MNSLCKILSFCFVIGFSYKVMAQQPANSCMRFLNLKSEYVNWDAGNGSMFVLTAYPLLRGDSIVVRRNGVQVGNFLTAGGRIISPRVVITDEAGKTEYIDSFRLSTDYVPADYFGYHTLLTVRWEYQSNGMPSRMSRKDRHGKDSLVLEWSADGTLWRKKEKSVQYQYSPDGTLKSAIWHGDRERILYYYPGGILQSCEVDTLVKNQLVRVVRNYSAAGILQKESWYKDVTPCETWREYDERGALVKTVKYPPLEMKPPVAEVVEAEVTEFVTFVEQQADFPGGEAAAFKQLESKLAPLFCKRRNGFSGKYYIHFEIKEDGMPVYRSAAGLNVAEIEPDLFQAIQALPRWRPAKRMGRPVRQGFLMVIQVE